MELLAFAIIPIYLIVGAFFWHLGLIIKNLNINHRRKAFKSNQTIIAEYTPPPGLKPAEIAYLYDQSVGIEEYLATIIDLEQRGYILIEAGDKPSALFANTTNKKTNDLNSFEADVYYDATQGEINTKHYRKWYERFWGNKFEYLLRQELVNKELLGDANNYESVDKNIKIITILISITWFVMQFTIGADVTTYDKLQNYIVVVFIFFLIILFLVIAIPFVSYCYKIFKKAKEIGNITPKLQELWPDIEGYKEYIELVELDRIKFENTIDRERALNEALPYAVALNLKTNWEQKYQ